MIRISRFWKGVLLLSLMALALACTASPPPTPAPEPTETATTLPSPTSSPQFSPTPQPSRTPRPTPSPLPPLTGHILFSSSREGNDEIYSMTADGSETTRLTDHPASDAYPVWSADGEQIAFVSNRDRNKEIYRMTVDGSEVTRLTDDRSIDNWPTWSPDGERIAWVKVRESDYDIYVMNADGSEQEPLIAEASSDLLPVWSPDGKYLLFQSDRGGSGFELYIAEADGSDPRPVATGYGLLPVPPQWSSSGEQFAFVATRTGQGRLYDIYLMDPEGENVTSVMAESEGFAHAPSSLVWSPDDLYFAYSSVSEDFSNTEIFLIGASGRGLRRLTNSEGERISNVPGDWKGPD